MATKTPAWIAVLWIGVVGLSCLCEGLTDTDIIEKARNAGGALVRMRPGEFHQAILKGPTQLTVVAVLTTKGDECEACRQVEGMLENVAGIFRRRHPTADNIVFASVSLVTSKPEDLEFAKAVGVEYVPVIYTFKPLTSRKQRPPIRESDAALFNIRAVPSVGGLSAYVAKQTGRSMPVIRSGPVNVADKVVRYRYEVVTAILGLGAVCVYLGLHHSRNFWLGVVLLVTCFSLAGGHYTLIHNAPLFVWQSGVPNFISPNGQRSQYLVEGLTWSAMVMSTSGLVLFLRNLPTVDSDFKNAFACVCLAISLVIFMAASALFTVKNPGYMYWSEV